MLMIMMMIVIIIIQVETSEGRVECYKTKGSNRDSSTGKKRRIMRLEDMKTK